MNASNHLIPPRIAARAKGLGRWPVAFAPRFYLAMAAGLIWLGPAWWNLRFGWAMVAWDALVLLAWAWDLRSLPRPAQVEVARDWKEPVSLGRPCPVKLEIRFDSKAQIVAFLEDETPPGLKAQPALLRVRASLGRAGGAQYEVQPRTRGDQKWGRVFVRYESPLRLAERRAVADLAQTGRIYPDLEESRRMSFYLLRSRQMEIEKRLQHRTDRGREFESLREYRDGDELRDICWTATARHGRLVTRVHRPERSQTVYLMVDLGRLMLARSGAYTKLDESVTAVLSLAQVAMAGGDKVGLIAYGMKIQTRLNPARGPLHLRLMLEQLALAHGEMVEADHARAVEMLMKSQRRRALIVWITDLAETAATPEVIESAIRLSPRHLVLFAALGQMDIINLLRSKPESAADMYRYAAATEVLARRETLLHRLREQGVLTLEAPAGRLATGLVNQYLRVKEESRL